ncbi:MAG: SRPBCC family protein [Bacteroidia bacterium]|nr:SRPBCC family protein [Bacteroidia bacterium]
MKTLKKILIGLIVIGAVFTLLMMVIAPNQAKIERTTTINAALPVVFNQVNNVKNWQKWSPWYEKDTTAKYTFSENPEGTGAWFSWEGNKDVGSGKLTHTSVEGMARIEDEMDFGEMGKANASFTFEEAEGGTKVTWGFLGDKVGVNPLGRLFNLLMDGLLGPDYEKGLAKLKTVCEAMPPLPNLDAKIENFTGKPSISIRQTTTQENMSEDFANMMSSLQGYLTAQGNEADGPFWAVWYTWGETIDVECGISVKGKVEGNGTIKATNSPSGKALSVVHKGPYEGLEAVHNAINEYILAMGYVVNGPPFEIYLNDPKAVQPEDIMTSVNYPIE